MSQSGLLLFPGEQVGADINGSGEEDTTDLGIFLNALSEGQSLADVNFDEQIDGNDVEQFMTDYTDPQRQLRFANEQQRPYRTPRPSGRGWTCRSARWCMARRSWNNPMRRWLWTPTSPRASTASAT